MISLDFHYAVLCFEITSRSDAELYVHTPAHVRPDRRSCGRGRALAFHWSACLHCMRGSDVTVLRRRHTA